MNAPCTIAIQGKYLPDADAVNAHTPYDVKGDNGDCGARDRRANRLCCNQFFCVHWRMLLMNVP
jgi:hypothetical protein